MTGWDRPLCDGHRDVLKRPFGVAKRPLVLGRPDAAGNTPTLPPRETLSPCSTLKRCGWSFAFKGRLSQQGPGKSQSSEVRRHSQNCFRLVNVTCGTAARSRSDRRYESGASFAAIASACLHGVAAVLQLHRDHGRKVGRQTIREGRPPGWHLECERSVVPQHELSCSQWRFGPVLQL